MNEFRKRIEELLNHLEHNGYNDGYHIRESDVEKFWNIFREAKKDFPKIQPSHDMDAVHDFNEWFTEWLI